MAELRYFSFGLNWQTHNSWNYKMEKMWVEEKSVKPDPLNRIG